ncbi:MAG TPA: type II secretion system F family protein [Gammaproteobacteria bacterium]|nr:type II secretion system F family protein [Gammaproteobacteria bacterium]
MIELFLYLSAIFAGASIGSFILLARFVDIKVPEEDRSYMDPLPPGLRILWGPIQVVAYYLVSNFSNSYLDSVDKKLQQTGVGYVLTAEQFVALRFVSAMICFLLALLLIASLAPEKGKLSMLLLAPVLGYMFPLVWLSDSRKRREKAVVRALPVYLDFITMAVEAGLNLTGALQQAMQKGPKGPLRNEFGVVLRDLRAGITRADALRRMSDRLQVSDITGFVNAMIQAERMGASLAAALRLQSEQRRNERFQRAEKMAMQAPVKLIFPLIVFIFPVTFIVLGFPIVMKFLAQSH